MYWIDNSSLIISPNFKCYLNKFYKSMTKIRSANYTGFHLYSWYSMLQTSLKIEEETETKLDCMLWWCTFSWLLPSHTPQAIYNNRYLQWIVWKPEAFHIIGLCTYWISQMLTCDHLRGCIPYKWDSYVLSYG